MFVVGKEKEGFMVGWYVWLSGVWLCEHITEWWLWLQNLGKGV